MKFECQVIESVQELKNYKIVPNQHNIVFVKLRHWISFFDESRPEEDRIWMYGKNRGTGKVSERTVRRVYDNYQASSFGVPVVSPDNNGDMVCADANSRTVGVLKLYKEDKLTRHQLDRLIAIQITDDLLENYVNVNAHDPHKNSNKIQNSDLLVGALAVKIQEAILPMKLPIADKTFFYRKIENILVAYNKREFKTDDIQNNAKALNDADDIWRNELVDVLATNPVNVNLSIGFSLRTALQRWINIREELLNLGNNYATKSADSVGLMSVLVVDFLTNGPISRISDSKIVANLDFAKVIGNSDKMTNMWRIYCDAIEYVSTTRKKTELTVKHWRNVEKILNRRYATNVSSNLYKVV